MTTPMSWKRLASPADLARFAEIMQTMDDRYLGLTPTTMQSWGEKKAALGKVPFVLGQVDQRGQIRQVTAVTVRTRTNGRTDQRRIHMIGVDIDSNAEPDIDDDRIMHWLGQTMYAMALQFGYPTTYETYRPKTMTWKPMERMHDLMREGLTIQLPGNAPLLRADVFDENDRGDALFWRIQLKEVTGPAAPVDVFLQDRNVAD